MEKVTVANGRKVDSCCEVVLHEALFLTLQIRSFVNPIIVKNVDLPCGGCGG